MNISESLVFAKIWQTFYNRSLKLQKRSLKKSLIQKTKKSGDPDILVYKTIL